MAKELARFTGRLFQTDVKHAEKVFSEIFFEKVRIFGKTVP
jgi:hypothetical protein